MVLPNGYTHSPILIHFTFETEQKDQRAKSKEQRAKGERGKRAREREKRESDLIGIYKTSWQRSGQMHDDTLIQVDSSRSNAFLALSLGKGISQNAKLKRESILLNFIVEGLDNETQTNLCVTSLMQRHHIESQWTGQQHRRQGHDAGVDTTIHSKREVSSRRTYRP